MHTHARVIFVICQHQRAAECRSVSASPPPASSDVPRACRIQRNDAKVQCDPDPGGRPCHAARDATTVGTKQIAQWRRNRLKSPLKFVCVGVKLQLERAVRNRTQGCGQPEDAAPGATRLGLRVTQLDPRRGSSIQNNRAQSPLLTCAANEQQPPEQLPYLQHSVSDILLDDASPLMRREGAERSLSAGQQLTAAGRILVLVATRVHGTMTDRQQPKHALTHTHAQVRSSTNYSARLSVYYAQTRAHKGRAKVEQSSARCAGVDSRWRTRR